MSISRLIPCLLIQHGLIVRSQDFRTHQVIGNPISAVQRLSNWNVDELVILDISEFDSLHDMRRDDKEIQYVGNTLVELLKQISSVCFMPLSVGGRIRTIEDIQARLWSGADKCIINTQAIESPAFITEASETFGAQCVVVSIDSRRHEDGTYEVYSDHGQKPTGLDPVAWAQTCEQLGAGEIFLTAIHRDGTGEGYDCALVDAVSRAVGIPIIACGGAGSYDDFATVLKSTQASAAAAANIFHFKELSFPIAKQACIDAGIDMRPVVVDSPWFPREPIYDRKRIDNRITERLRKAEQGPRPNCSASHVRWCTKCVQPSLSATPMAFDEKGVCMGCRTAENKVAISNQEWQARHELLFNFLDERRNKAGGADVVIPVSGGKDSYFQTHVITEMGFRPLLVTYNGNNFSDVGWRNLSRMKDHFDCEHIVLSPDPAFLSKLNRLGFIVMGDMNWHNHIGLFSYPMSVAVERKIKAVIWGEHGYADIAGMFGMNDFMEYTYRARLEHAARSYEWNYFVGLEGITASDMAPYKYPSDRDILDADMRGLYLSNFVRWEANEHLQLVIDEYGFEISEEGFDRTYRKGSNLDDIHENGVHDYLKFIKFGYGRCTDHASKDIRAGVMTRQKAVELVRQYDHVKPRDLARWLDYTGMSESEFDRIADTFRDPRVWHYENGHWQKNNVWD